MDIALTKKQGSPFVSNRDPCRDFFSQSTYWKVGKEKEMNSFFSSVRQGEGLMFE